MGRDYGMGNMAPARRSQPKANITWDLSKSLRENVLGPAYAIPSVPVGGYPGTPRPQISIPPAPQGVQPGGQPDYSQVSQFMNPEYNNPYNPEPNRQSPWASILNQRATGTSLPDRQSPWASMLNQRATGTQGLDPNSEEWKRAWWKRNWGSNKENPQNWVEAGDMNINPLWFIDQTVPKYITGMIKPKEPEKKYSYSGYGRGGGGWNYSQYTAPEYKTPRWFQDMIMWRI